MALLKGGLPAGCPVCGRGDCLWPGRAAGCERAEAIRAGRALAEEYREWRAQRGLQPTGEFELLVRMFVVQARTTPFPGMALVVDE